VCKTGRREGENQPFHKIVYAISGIYSNPRTNQHGEGTRVLSHQQTARFLEQQLQGAFFPTSTTAQLLQQQTTVAQFSNINYSEHFPNKHL
jgi:hypothetical protein